MFLIKLFFKKFVFDNTFLKKVFSRYLKSYLKFFKKSFLGIKKSKI